MLDEASPVDAYHGGPIYPADVNWAMALADLSMVQLFDRAVAAYPDRPALDFLDRTFTYAELGAAVNHAAKGFRALGVQQGVHVGLFLPNCPYFVVAYYAVLKAGGTVVNYNPLYAQAELEHQIEDSRTSIMVTLDLNALYPKVARALETTSLERVVVCRMASSLAFPKNLLFPWLKKSEIAAFDTDDTHIAYDTLVHNDGVFERAELDPGRDIAVLQYTGGTTGVPKGAILTHRNLAANTQQVLGWFPETVLGQERMLAVLPFFHVFGMTTAMNFSIRAGAEIVMLPRFELKQLLSTIHRKKPTLFPAVPTIFNAINRCPQLGKYDLTSLKACISGGAPLPVEVKQSFEATTGCTVVEGYGLSETAPVASCNPLSGVNKPGSIGLPLPRTRIEIVSLDDGESVLSPGEKGEICITGPQVMAGYWQHPEATARALRGGRFHTGDVGYQDEDGYTFLVDRLKEVILAGGYNIYPRVIEEAIYAHPAVAEAAVIGVDDAYRGQTVKAFIVVKDGEALDEASLRRFLSERISPIEMPKEIAWREALPKSAVGKIMKKELVAEQQQQQQAAAEMGAPA
ncbi:MAG: long-chain fatty acid--CoA ligase [Geminicoccaceae bacterium]